MSLIDAYVNEDITITSALLTRSNSGQYDYTGQSAIPTKARILDKKKNEYREDRVVTVYDNVFLLKSTETIKIGDKIIHDSISHQVVEVKRGQHIDGLINHYRVMVKIDGIR